MHLQPCLLYLCCYILNQSYYSSSWAKRKSTIRLNLHPHGCCCDRFSDCSTGDADLYWRISSGWSGSTKKTIGMCGRQTRILPGCQLGCGHHLHCQGSQTKGFVSLCCSHDAYCLFLHHHHPSYFHFSEYRPYRQHSTSVSIIYSPFIIFTK